jgi:hypothetical protein
VIWLCGPMKKSRTSVTRSIGSEKLPDVALRPPGQDPDRTREQTL